MSLSSGASSSSGSIGSRNRQREPPGTGYFAYRHQPGFENDGVYEPVEFRPATAEPRYAGFGNGEPPGGNRRVGAVSVQNGALNLQIPCAFSYGYDRPSVPKSESKSNSSRSSKPTVVTKESIANKKPNTRTTKNGPAASSAVSSNRATRGTSVGDKGTTGLKVYPRTGEVKPAQRSTKVQGGQDTNRPFVGTVKSGQLYKAKKVPVDNRTQARTTMVWDVKPGAQVPFRVVDYGEELYEIAAQNLALQLKQQKLDERKTSADDSNDNCIDYSKPGVQSSRYITRALDKAVKDLKNLPKEVETLLKEDKRFETLIAAKATRALNAPRSSQVFQNLIPVDPNPDVMTEAEQMIQAEIKKSIEAARPPPRQKDPEPKLEDFQTNSYTRIRPAAVPTPSKPTSGTSIEANHDFDTIEDEKRIQGDSNRF